MTSTKMYLSVLLFLILVIPVVSGSISVQNIAITPSGDLISGQNPPQKVSISYGINFIPSGGVTFSDSDTLGMSTDLDNAHWNYTIILDGNPNTPQIANGKKLDISGWDLSYPSRRDLSMKVILTGDVPVVPATQQKILLDIADYTANGPVPGSEVIKQANIILPGSVPLTATSTTGIPGVTNPQTTITSPVPTSAGCNPHECSPCSRIIQYFPGNPDDHLPPYFIYSARTPGVPRLFRAWSSHLPAEFQYKGCDRCRVCPLRCGPPVRNVCGTGPLQIL